METNYDALVRERDAKEAEQHKLLLEFTKTKEGNEEKERIKVKLDQLKKELIELSQQISIARFGMMEPFNGDVNKIPSIPRWEGKLYNDIVIPNLIRCGAIPKNQLEVGKTYIGDCRNASEAIWNGKVFIYKRHKFGFVFDEKINHFEDDNGYDLFVPIAVKEE